MKKRILTLGNGERVTIEIHKHSVRLLNKLGEWVSFNPSMKSTGISSVDAPHVLVQAGLEVAMEDR